MTTAKAPDLYHDPIHPAVQELAVQRATGYYDAEDALRGMAGRGDPKAAAVIKEVDDGRAARRAGRKKFNEQMTQALGLDARTIATLVARLAADKALWTWLCGRVNRTTAYGTPLAADD